MVADQQGRWCCQLELQYEPGQVFSWGVKERGVWLLFTRTALEFVPSQCSTQSFRLGDRHRLGLNPMGRDGFRAGLWAPGAVEVQLQVANQSCSLTQQGEFWFHQSDSGWSQLLGKPYHFELLTSEGDRVVRVDPYARRRQGPQRGVSDLFVRADGSQTHRYAQDEDGAHLLRFELLSQKLRQPPHLVLAREGQALTSQQLRQLLKKEVKLPSAEAWWLEGLDKDGRIAMRWQPEAKAYSVCVGEAAQLRGLEYRFLSPKSSLGWSDPWSSVLEGRHNWSRCGVVSNPVSHQVELTPLSDEVIIYELHIGSLLGSGQNLRTSTFEDVAAKLTEIRDLGFTAIALMPTNPTEGHRDWGYLGTCSMAHHQSLAAPGRWAEESLVEFIDEAHRLGLRVFTDVVYNHVGGDHNDWWEFDGRTNPYFEWDQAARAKDGLASLPHFPEDTADAIPQTLKPSVKNTPWGPIPAYNRGAVFQFFVDHAMDQLQRIGFDGIRFDFTNYIHTPSAGGAHGWRLLQEINKRVRHFFPHAMTFAEEFPPAPVITNSVEQGGAGFDAMWNTEHQHRLVFHHHGASVTTALASGQHPPLESFLAHLIEPQGFSSPKKSATVLSNHDEVGNAARLASLVKGHPRSYDIARLVCWVSLLSPGYPILFQGTEDLAENFFSWGIPSTWDVDSHLQGRLKPHRMRHLKSIAEVLRFRRDHPALHAEVPICEHFLVGRLMGFRRGNYWLVANFGEGKLALPKSLGVSTKPVLNSESRRYGYGGKATRGRNVGAYACKLFPVME